MKHRNIMTITSVLLLAGCGFQPQSTSSKIAQSIAEKVQCRDFEPYFWHTLHDATLNDANPKSWDELKEAFKSQRNFQNEKVLPLLETLEKFLGPEFWQKTQGEQLEIWAQLELKMEDRKGWPEMQLELAQRFKEQSADKSQICQPDDLTSEQKDKKPSELGGRWVMATAYQSCEASRLPAMTTETASTEGIKITGRHPDGGQIRVIGNLQAVQKTHPYLRIQNKESDCFDVQSKPLIYDFGGKPGYSSSGGNEIDLFKNQGTGSRELGIDCSGLVYASFGVQGLRLIPNQDMVAGFASGIGSSGLLNPPKEWKCVQRISVGFDQGLKPSDVISIKGHTVLIDEVGEDPWGMRFITQKSQCARITEDQLNFTVLQSSPSKGGAGINRYIIKDYLKETEKMRTGVLKYAKAHCEAHFDKKTTRPVWNEVSIIRHVGGPDCKGRPLVLKKESCIASCPGVMRP